MKINQRLLSLTFLLTVPLYLIQGGAMNHHSTTHFSDALEISPIKKDERNLADYDKVAISGPLTVEIVDGYEGKIIVDAPERILPNIITVVKNKKLSIKLKKSSLIKNITRRNNGIKITVPISEINSLILSGSGKVFSSQKILKSEDFSLTLSGSGTMQSAFETDDMTINLSGSGKIDIEGETNTILVNISGSGKLNAKNLKAQSANLRLSGSAKAEIYSEEVFKANISGSGKIYCYGNPQQKQKVSVIGSGKVVFTEKEARQ